MLKSLYRLFLFLGLLSLISATIFSIDQDALEDLKNEQVSEVLALYDHEANVALYKDASIPACFIERLEAELRDLDTREIVLTGKPLNVSTRKVMASRFQKEFCSNLPVYEMDMNSAMTEPLRRVHRSRRGKRNAYDRQQGGPDDNLRRGHRTGGTQHHWSGSQTQVNGNVAGNGHFSGQAQSTGGLSQSQIQLGGVGLTGSMSSGGGGAQSALRLGSRSGSGQISSSGHGQSASELQLNLGEQGQESAGRAMVMQQHQSGQANQLHGSSDFGSRQDSGMQSSHAASGVGSEQSGSWRRQYFDGDGSETASHVQQQPHRSLTAHGGYGTTQPVLPGYRGSGSDTYSNYDQSHFSSSTPQHQGQGFGEGQAQERNTRTETSISSGGNGRGFQGSTTSGQNMEGGSQTTPKVTEGRSQIYQPNMIQTPRDFAGNGFQGQFRSDSVTLRESPGMIPAPGHGHTQQSTQSQQFSQTQQRFYPQQQQQQQQPRSDSFRTTTNGFRMRTETFKAPDFQQYPSRQGGGARIESNQEEQMTTHSQQYPTQERQNGIQTPQYGTRDTNTRTDMTETETSLQHQPTQTQFGHRQPARGFQQTEDSSTSQRTYTQQSELPMMTSYPITNGRRVYQRRIVTYYPGQMTPVSLQPHYVQQTMTGRQPQAFPQNQGTVQQQPSVGIIGDTSRCHTVTLQCTVIFDSNGKSKLCQPKPATASAICCC